MIILVSNVGSTSLKFKLFNMPKEEILCEAKIERVGSLDSAIFSYKNFKTGYFFKKEGYSIPDYTDGIRLFVNYMTDSECGVIENTAEIDAIGFKTVLAKGYYGVHELDEDVIQAMKDYLFVAPAHNPPYLKAINQFKSIIPDASYVGVFETAFHSTIPIERRLYSIPYEWFEKYGIMRMGYHGASHSYIADQADADKVISCHLGGSCSICAIENKKSVDTSFGFSVQTGIPHANRVGDIDPYIIPFLESEGLSIDEIMNGLAKNGGLLGISGVSNDLRLVQEAASSGDSRSQLAIDVLAVAIIRYIGSFYAELGGLDKLVFTGGIGENSPILREKICEKLPHLGIMLDKEANNQCFGAGIISAANSPVEIAVIPANEELGVARRTYEKIVCCG